MVGGIYTGAHGRLVGSASTGLVGSRDSRCRGTEHACSLCVYVEQVKPLAARAARHVYVQVCVPAHPALAWHGRLGGTLRVAPAGLFPPEAEAAGRLPSATSMGRSLATAQDGLSVSPSPPYLPHAPKHEKQPPEGFFAGAACAGAGLTATGWGLAPAARGPSGGAVATAAPAVPTASLEASCMRVGKHASQGTREGVRGQHQHQRVGMLPWHATQAKQTDR